MVGDALDGVPQFHGHQRIEALQVEWSGVVQSCCVQSHHAGDFAPH